MRSPTATTTAAPTPTPTATPTRERRQDGRRTGRGTNVETQTRKIKTHTEVAFEHFNTSSLLMNMYLRTFHSNQLFLLKNTLFYI
jgi:hypothetical protein